MYSNQIPLYLNGEQFLVDNKNQGKFVVKAQLQILIVSLLWSGGMVMCWSYVGLPLLRRCFVVPRLLSRKDKAFC